MLVSPKVRGNAEDLAFFFLFFPSFVQWLDNVLFFPFLFFLWETLEMKQIFMDEEIAKPLFLFFFSSPSSFLVIREIL